MDIVTHAIMGIAGAGPLLVTHPVAGVAFVFGSVAPDLDALSRVFGKQAFLRWHQTYSHSLPVIAVLSCILIVAFGLGGSVPPIAGLGFGAGMIFHSLLDVSNTYGIKLFAPFSKRRLCLEWVFFIDWIVFAISSACCCGVVLALMSGSFETLTMIGWAFWFFVFSYWGLKGILRWRAKQLSPSGTGSLVPSAMAPWWFLGTGRNLSKISLFRINAINGAVSNTETVEPLDGGFEEQLEASSEFQTMRELSEFYHVVEIENVAGDTGTVLRCRDLRTRNFNTSFGNLKLVLDEKGTRLKTEWKV